VAASYTGLGDLRPEPIVHNDTGTAARYFHRFKYVGRAPPAERTRGLEHWHWVGDPDDPEGWRRLTTAEALDTPKRKRITGSNHPTIKVFVFTEWIARLILPPMGPEALRVRGEATRLLVPFSGVLSEAIGAAQAGWPEILAIENSASYVAQGADRYRAWGPYGEDRQGRLW